MENQPAGSNTFHSFILWIGAWITWLFSITAGQLEVVFKLLSILSVTMVCVINIPKFALRMRQFAAWVRKIFRRR